MNHCDFCNEFGGGIQNAFAERYGCALHSRLLISTPWLRVVPSLGQIVEGHLLVTPLTHFCALADMPREAIEDLDHLTKQIRSALKRYGRESVFFEHGMRGQSGGGCGIEHAHLHAVPVAGGGVLDILMGEFGGSAIDGFEDIRDAVRQESSYLFFEDSSANRYVFPVEELPSQYMRKLVADSIGKSDWDWRKCGQEPELIATLERLAPLFPPAAIVPGE